MNLVEFKAGQKVTFNAYNEKVKAVVIDVDPDEKSGKIFYVLKGRDGDILVSNCTGFCIEESVYFVPFNPNTGEKISC